MSYRRNFLDADNSGMEKNLRFVRNDVEDNFNQYFGGNNSSRSGNARDIAPPRDYRVVQPKPASMQAIKDFLLEAGFTRNEAHELAKKTDFDIEYYKRKRIEMQRRGVQRSAIDDFIHDEIESGNYKKFNEINKVVKSKSRHANADDDDDVSITSYTVRLKTPPPPKISDELTKYLARDLVEQEKPSLKRRRSMSASPPPPPLLPQNLLMPEKDHQRQQNYSLPSATNQEQQFPAPFSPINQNNPINYDNRQLTSEAYFPTYANQHGPVPPVDSFAYQSNVNFPVNPVQQNYPFNQQQMYPPNNFNPVQNPYEFNGNNFPMSPPAFNYNYPPANVYNELAASAESHNQTIYHNPNIIVCGSNEPASNRAVRRSAPAVPYQKQQSRNQAMPKQNVYNVPERVLVVPKVANVNVSIKPTAKKVAKIPPNPPKQVSQSRKEIVSAQKSAEKTQIEKPKPVTNAKIRVLSPNQIIEKYKGKNVVEISPQLPKQDSQSRNDAPKKVNSADIARLQKLKSAVDAKIRIHFPGQSMTNNTVTDAQKIPHHSSKTDLQNQTENLRTEKEKFAKTPQTEKLKVGGDAKIRVLSPSQLIEKFTVGGIVETPPIQNTQNQSENLSSDKLAEKLKATDNAKSQRQGIQNDIVKDTMEILQVHTQNKMSKAENLSSDKLAEKRKATDNAESQVTLPPKKSIQNDNVNDTMEISQVHTQNKKSKAKNLSTNKLPEKRKAIDNVESRVTLSPRQEIQNENVNDTMEISQVHAQNKKPKADDTASNPLLTTQKPQLSQLSPDPAKKKIKFKNKQGKLFDPDMPKVNVLMAMWSDDYVTLNPTLIAQRKNIKSVLDIPSDPTQKTPYSHLTLEERNSLTNVQIHVLTNRYKKLKNNLANEKDKDLPKCSTADNEHNRVTETTKISEQNTSNLNVSDNLKNDDILAIPFSPTQPYALSHLSLLQKAILTKHEKLVLNRRFTKMRENLKKDQIKEKEQAGAEEKTLKATKTTEPQQQNKDTEKSIESIDTTEKTSENPETSNQHSVTTIKPNPEDYWHKWWSKYGQVEWHVKNIGASDPAVKNRLTAAQTQKWMRQLGPKKIIETVEKVNEKNCAQIEPQKFFILKYNLENPKFLGDLPIDEFQVAQAALKTITPHKLTLLYQGLIVKFHDSHEILKKAENAGTADKSPANQLLNNNIFNYLVNVALEKLKEITTKDWPDFQYMFPTL